VDTEPDRMIDVNGPRIGELDGFPSSDCWPDEVVMLTVLNECRRMVSSLASFEDVDAYWRSEYAKAKV